MNERISKINASAGIVVVGYLVVALAAAGWLDEGALAAPAAVAAIVALAAAAAGCIDRRAVATVVGPCR